VYQHRTIARPEVTTMRRRIALLLAGLPLVLALGWAAAGVVSAGGGCHGESENQVTPAEADAAVIKIDGCTFAPTVARVAAGTEVRFINASETHHDIVGRNHGWGTDSLEAGTEFKYRFLSAGVYPFSCSLHPGMAGVVIVGDAATAADGGAADADMAQAASSEPAAATSTETSVLPFVAVATVSLLAGAALGIAGARAFTRRDEAA
jgi:plastocyanin